VTLAAITGGRGFAGQHLARELVAAGQDVVLLDRSDGFDVADRAHVHDRFTGLCPQVVYHLAAFTHVGDSWQAPVETWRVNTEGTLNVLDACVAAGVGRVVVVGSAEEYGRIDPAIERVDETAELRPASPYAASKVAADYLALQAFLGEALETVRVRPFNHSGPGQSPRFLVPAVAARIASAEADGRDTIAVGNLDPVRELLDVRDVVRAYRLLAELGEPGAVYNVCSGVGRPVREPVEAMLAHSTRPLQLVVDPALVRPVDVPRLVGDPTCVHAATGWEPQIPLAQTLREVLEDARHQLT
jgi:GDP-4-dehydro-6-deoxy-D-mannose reductase